MKFESILMCHAIIIGNCLDSEILFLIEILIFKIEVVCKLVDDKVKIFFRHFKSIIKIHKLINYKLDVEFKNSIQYHCYNIIKVNYLYNLKIQKNENRSK